MMMNVMMTNAPVEESVWPGEILPLENALNQVSNPFVAIPVYVFLALLSVY